MARAVTAAVDFPFLAWVTVEAVSVLRLTLRRVRTAGEARTVAYSREYVGAGLLMTFLWAKLEEKSEARSCGRSEVSFLGGPRSEEGRRTRRKKEPMRAWW